MQFTSIYSLYHTLEQYDNACWLLIVVTSQSLKGEWYQTSLMYILPRFSLGASLVEHSTLINAMRPLVGETLHLCAEIAHMGVT